MSAIPRLAAARRAGIRTSTGAPSPALRAVAKRGPCLLLVAGCKTTPTPPSADAAVAVPFVAVDHVFGPLKPGDAVTITAVRGPTAAVALGDTYQVDGTYTLSSRDSATLCAFETAGQPNEPHRRSIPGQSAAVRRGTGTFSLRLKVEDPGYPHISFYSAGGIGESFGGEYFGTGDFVAPAAWRQGGPR